MGTLRTFVCFLGVWLLFVDDAHAYLDPGTGSLAIQALAAVAVGLAITARAWMRTAKALFRRLTGKPAAHLTPPVTSEGGETKSDGGDRRSA